MAELNINGPTVGNQLNELLCGDDIQPGSAASYSLCKQIYAYHPLGGKMAEAPIAMAMSQARDITVPGSPEDRVVKAFADEWKKLRSNDHIFAFHTLKRVYGIASLAILDDNMDPTAPVDFAKLWQQEIAFSILDPLNTAGSLVGDLNPNSMGFMKTGPIAVQGVPYHRSRTVVALNGQALYLEYTTSAFGYVGRSSYQAGLYLLKSFIETMVADALVAKKAGVFIAAFKQAGSIITNAMATLFGVKRDIIKESGNSNVISIGTEERIETLNMQNANDAIQGAAKRIKENLAASDNMPAQLLNDETFAEGFGEGTEDAKRVAQYIDRVRVDMQPTYDFMDRIVQSRAWNPEFYETIKAEYPEEYGDVEYNDAFYRWQNAFVATWPNLLTEPDSEKAKSEDVRLKAIIALVEVLLPQMDPDNRATLIMWAADNFNGLGLLFDHPLNLDFEALASYEPPAPVEKEPTEPKPFSAQDAAQTMRRLHRAAA